MFSGQSKKNGLELNCVTVCTAEHLLPTLMVEPKKKKFYVLSCFWQWQTVQCFCVCISALLGCCQKPLWCGGSFGKAEEWRRWEERGRAGRLTTYWWNEKSLPQPDNLPPSHLVMNATPHWSPEQLTRGFAHFGAALLSIWHILYRWKHDTICVLHAFINTMNCN